MQTWPGPYTATGFIPRGEALSSRRALRHACRSPHHRLPCEGKTPAHVYPSYPGCKDCEPTPQSNTEWRAALRRHFGFAQALFLSIAEPNMYWMCEWMPAQLFSM